MPPGCGIPLGITVAAAGQGEWKLEMNRNPLVGKSCISRSAGDSGKEDNIIDVL